jgi:hypothetical protein
MFSKIIALALAVGHCQAGKTWIRGGTTCVGVDSTMDATVMYGPCTSSSMADLYISQTMVGAGMTGNSNTYFTTPANMAAEMTKAEFMTPTMTAARAKQNVKGGTTQPDCEFAYAQASAKLTGDVTVQYAAVINSGSGDCKASTVQVINPTLAGVTTVTETNAICIDSTSAGTTCAERTFEPSSLKFSAGVGFGPSFTLGTSGTSSLATMYVGYRLRYDYATFGTGAVLTYNTAVAAADLGATQVLSFTVTSKDQTQSTTVTLDQKYSYGTMSTAGVFAKTGVATIVTRSYPVAGTTSFYVDFLFSKDWVGANKYIMYDPKMSSVGGSDASSSSHVVASAFTVALLAAVASLV